MLAAGERLARELEGEIWTRTGLDVPRAGMTAALRRLEREGAICGRWSEPERGPARKIFGLTETGQKDLDRRRRAWWRFAAAVEEVLDDAG